MVLVLGGMIRLIDLKVYKVALEIGSKVHNFVIGWDHFNRDTLGKQFVRAADSMALNISEGYGRFHFKENKNFAYYSRGSAFESTTCLRKAVERNLITPEENAELRKSFGNYFKLINGYIKSIGHVGDSNSVNDDAIPYNSAEFDLDNYLSNEW